jgi:hypothetical protein
VCSVSTLLIRVQRHLFARRIPKSKGTKEAIIGVFPCQTPRTNLSIKGVSRGLTSSNSRREAEYKHLEQHYPS